jgi:hypothetical protein
MPNGETDGVMPDVFLEPLRKAGFVHRRSVDPFNMEFRPPAYRMVLREP